MGKNKNGKKFAIAILFVVLSVCILGGCAGTEEKRQDTKETWQDDMTQQESDSKNAAAVPSEEGTAAEPETEPLTVEQLRQSAELNSSQPFMNLYKRNKETGVFDIKYDYAAPWVWYSDIGGFYVFATDEAQFAYDGFKARFFDWWDSYGQSADTKIGYEVIVGLNDGTELICTIKSPEDTEEIFRYVELYLYDDVHQEDGAWYSHLLQEQMTDDTLMTSIKVTTGEKINEVESIYLTVFTYQSEADFDMESGRYIGGNYTGLEIGKQ